jgi:hypothetical protein
LDEAQQKLSDVRNKDVHISTICRALHNLPRKRTYAIAQERDEQQRAEYKQLLTLHGITKDMIVSVDEMGHNNRAQDRNYGRAPPGVRAEDDRTLNRGKKHSLIGALTIDGIGLYGSGGSGFQCWTIC